jgi:hypothetical protein
LFAHDQRGKRFALVSTGNWFSPFRTTLSDRPVRRKFRNFSINRPETTNLNHQYAIRRVFI